jgi:LuxR family maltose regulon positive regulatory protein
VEKFPEFIVSSKLRRPPLSRDHLHRPQLLSRLDEGLHNTVNLISAPAGYGKSTLASCWIETCGLPFAWISLDRKDDDLRLFLLYFISALRSISEYACTETLSILRSITLPPDSVLTDRLINEMDSIDTNYIVVLDDYHHIQNQQIHTLLSALLNAPPGTMHLVLISRRDPPLPLASLRAKGRMTETRTQNLRLSPEEARNFLQLMSHKPLGDKLVAALCDKSEGWVTGLRLAALAMAQRRDHDILLHNVPTENSYLVDYVVAELISCHEPVVQECILKISILDRFCAPLCEKICFPDAESRSCQINSRDFLQMLEDSSLFITPLDEADEWFRHHHLIQSILQRLLRKRFTAEQVICLYRDASLWFADQGYLEEALSYLLVIEDHESAATLVADYRYDLINREQWYHLDLWLRQFPLDFIKKNVPLLLSKAWVYQRQARYSKLFELLGDLDAIGTSPDNGAGLDLALRGEVATLKSFYCYSTARAERAEQEARFALAHLPEHSYSLRGFSLIILALALQMRGETPESLRVIDTAWNKEEQINPVFRTMLLAALCFHRWIGAELVELQTPAEILIETGTRDGLPETVEVGRFFCGISKFERNELDSAESYLLPVFKKPVKGELVVPSIVTYCQSSFALALACQIKGHPDKAREISETVLHYMLETGNADLLDLCRAFRAELALRQGHSDAAVKWCAGYDPEPLRPVYRFFAPELTFIKAKIAVGGRRTIEEIDRLVVRMHHFYKGLHNTRMMIHLGVLGSAVKNLRGDHKAAVALLGEAIERARHGGIMRPFLDFADQLEKTVQEVAASQPGNAYAVRILQAMAAEQRIASSAPVKKEAKTGLQARVAAEPLSNREIQVLKALQYGGKNKDIAESLYISVETVKRHLSTIYRKLNVENRQQAVHQARKYGIL